MPLQATSGAASYDAFGGGAAAVPQYIEDVFSTYLYTGNSLGQTITNVIDLSTKGGLVWMKERTASPAGTGNSHNFVDTARGVGKLINSNTTAAQQTYSTVYELSAFNNNGFTLALDGGLGMNENTVPTVSWTFREQPKFFDIVTYTGTGANTTIAHNLGSVPGCIMVKRLDAVGAWQVYHRSLANTEYLVLNDTAAKATGATRWNSTTPTSTVFSVGTDATVNASGGTYVAYIYAHDAGGFGLAGTDNVISCGSFTTDGSGTFSDVNLGYEPQWVLAKNTTGAGSWILIDSMRGMPVTNNSANVLLPNLSNAESTGYGWSPRATGFGSQGGNFAVSSTYIYIAIRKGPMKVPTDATKVFSPTISSAALGTVLTTGFPIDTQFMFYRSGGFSTRVATRLIGVATTAINSGDSYLQTASTAAEVTPSSGTRYWDNTGFQMPGDWAGTSMIFESFRRAPSFFDVVCYTGTGSATTVTHNLTVVPELIIVKSRSSVSGWPVYSSSLANTEYVALNTSTGKTTGSIFWNSTTPTSSVFSLGASAVTNNSGSTYVAYLFATCAGVSKVGGYTGTGTLTTIDCGFTGGARFVLIKRTDTTGDWYVWDTARGMVAGTDPSFRTNSTASEVNANSVYTIATGFQLLASPSAPVNTNAATYIFLAIA